MGKVCGAASGNGGALPVVPTAAAVDGSVVTTRLLSISNGTIRAAVHLPSGLPPEPVPVLSRNSQRPLLVEWE